MPRHFFAYTPVVAYASITGSNLNKDSDLDLLRRWCLRTPMKLDVIAEEIPPGDSHRPLWSEILDQIERGNITTLVVPSLFHLAGNDLIGLSKILTFLKANHVILKSLAEVIDSRRSSRHEIIMSLSQALDLTAREIHHE